MRNCAYFKLASLFALRALTQLQCVESLKLPVSWFFVLIFFISTRSYKLVVSSAEPRKVSSPTISNIQVAFILKSIYCQLKCALFS
jgi:hypothetical protein